MSMPEPLSLAANGLPAAPDKVSTQSFLKFHLEPDMTALLPVQHLVEILKVPLGQITAIPHLPGWIMGVYNWRGEILWMVDLGQLLGLTPWSQQATAAPHYATLVLEAPVEEVPQMTLKRPRLGVVVHRLEDIERLDPDTLQSPPGAVVTDALAPFLKGYWVTAQGDMLSWLDTLAFFAQMPKAHFTL